MIKHLDIPVSETFEKAVGYFQGVPIFFALSGYLIWLSIKRSRSIKDYIRRRFLRIYPELWVAVAVEIIVMLLLYHDWKIKDLAAFIFGQATILQFWTPNSLRGYGCGTPNGSLWTIGIIIQFYIIIWFLYKFLHNKKLSIWIICWVGSVAISIGINRMLISFAPEVVLKLFGQTFLRYLWLFAIGCFFAEFQGKLLIHAKKFWWIFLLISIVLYAGGLDIDAGYSVITSFFLFAGILGAAYCYPKLNLKNDISYGIYLYHMIVVNAMITWGMTGKVFYIFIVVLVSSLLAWTSAKIVKKDFLIRRKI